ncbi:MAG TPA: hypothetical protein PKL85_12950, partial [Bacteroidia bacterium]|nr:hypothetical protein [Bacteroidia bacterium]
MLLSKAGAQETAVVLHDSTYIYRSLKEARQNPENVYRLNLSKSKLDTFPADIFLFTHLVELDLSRNRIDSVPPQIGQLSNLVRLNLANNKLTALPDEIGNLKNLV